MDSSQDIASEVTTAFPSTLENIFLILSVILASGCGALSVIQLSAQYSTCITSWRRAVPSRSYWLHSNHALLSLLTATTVFPAIASVAQPPSHYDTEFFPPAWNTLLYLLPVTLLVSNCHCLIQLTFIYTQNSTKRHCKRVLFALLLLQWTGCCSVVILACCGWWNPVCVITQSYLSFVYCPHQIYLLVETVGWMLLVEISIFSLLVLSRVRQNFKRQRNKGTYKNGTDNFHLKQEYQTFIDNVESPEISGKLLVKLTPINRKHTTNCVEQEQQRGADTLLLGSTQLIMTLIIDITHIIVSHKNLDNIHGSGRFSIRSQTNISWVDELNTVKHAGIDEEVRQNVFNRIRWLILVQIGCRFLQLVMSLLQNQTLGEHVLMWLQKQCCCCRGQNLIRPLPVTVSEFDVEIEEDTTETETIDANASTQT